ncbi:palmitoleoyl-protein carboxylesterase notum1a-like [Hydractinia symbiolongicarpus]|uniref:palmitoleoyl-protein carboxylesterase notum1a-like n=1 Tax=Hydractinia symbiolongicarpus TaxID=13093 RepID=UPI00254C702D|nr:palmitoleoyl-protein carboxylesterase notum1a-like [Hydractinia symbiolongicarpus]
MYIHIIFVLLMVGVVRSLPSQCSWLAGEKCVKSALSMSRRYLSASLATCNDGSSAGYYIRREKESKLWIVYLEGGWFCFNERTCMQRFNHSSIYSMTSSKLWPKLRQGDGLLNVHAKHNPQFHKANHVYVPYCSSDFWIGNTTQTTSKGVKIGFQGAHIIMEVIKDLLKNGLKDSSRLFFVGSSAGGIGVLQNIDRIANFLKRKKLNIDVRGMIDSSWFVDNGISTNCASSNVYECHPQLMFKQAASYWNAVVDHSCGKKHVEKHKCLFALNAIEHINTPIFVFQWIHDTAQILADNKDLELDPKKIFSYKYKQYVKKLGETLRTSLKDINSKHGIFAASCISHTALATSESLNKIKIEGNTLNDALYCWLANNKRNHRSSAPCKQRLIDTCKHPHCHGNCPVVRNPMTGEKIIMKTPSSGKKLPFDMAKMDLDLINRLLTEFKG